MPTGHWGRKGNTPPLPQGLGKDRQGPHQLLSRCSQKIGGSEPGPSLPQSSSVPVFPHEPQSHRRTPGPSCFLTVGPRRVTQYPQTSVSSSVKWEP